MLRRPRWTADEVVEFCGWDFLARMISATELTGYKELSQAPLKIARNKALIAAEFLTGGRISEGLMVQKKHFDFVQSPAHVVVRAMPIVKRYKKVRTIPKWKCDAHCKMRWLMPPGPELLEHHGKIVEYAGWETKSKLAYRTFPFPKNEPLVPIIESWIEPLAPDDLLFKKLSYQRAYEITTRIGKILGTWIPTHWFRAQRASQLAFEYGFNEFYLTRFFDWKSYKEAFHYARKGYIELATKMVR